MEKYGTFIDCKCSLLAEHLNFLAKAVIKDITRPAMQHIYVEQSEVDKTMLKGVATDGRRLHIVDPLDKPAADYGLAVGYWRVLKTTSKPIVWIARLDDSETNKFQFPNYHRVIPSQNPLYKTTFPGCDKKLFSNDMIEFLRKFPESTSVNPEHLIDLGTELTWDVKWYGAFKAMKFTGANRIAVIMPKQV